MSGVSTFNIGGLASGLDTNSILSQLMQIERIPITQLQSRQSALKKVDDAWAGINTRLSGFRAAIDAIKSPAKFDAFISHTSSKTDVISVTSTGAATPGAVQLTVEQLAYAGQRASGDEFNASTDAIGARTMSITVGGETWNLDPADDTTVAEFVTSINNSGAPVRAQLVKVDTKYQIVMTADQTGVDNDFSLTLGGWGSGFSTLQTAQDAEIRVGDPVTGLLVTRASNTITDVIDGAQLQLHDVSASPVTITSTRNENAIVGSVKSLVEAANNALTALREASAFNAETLQAAPLTGDPTVRRLAGEILRTMSDLLSGASEDFATPSTLGIEITRDGKVTFDESVLREALKDDYAGVVGALTRSGTSDVATLTYVGSTDATQAGTYEIAVTQAATKASITGDAYAASDETFTITSGTRVATINATAAMSLTDLVTEINTQLTAAGIGSVRAEESGGAIRLFESDYGSSAAFTVESSEDPDTTVFGLAGTHAGLDVIATVDGGDPITGKGQLLTVADGDAAGLSVRIQAVGLGVVGDITVGHGLAGGLSALLKPYEGSSGLIQGARNEAKAGIEDYQDRIESMERRLAQREINLRRQFTAMETAMNQLAQQGNRLASALASLNGGSG